MPDNEEPKKSFFEKNSLLTDMLAGGTASSLAKTLVAPIERVKLLLQVQPSPKDDYNSQSFKGPLDCFTRILKQEGFLSFWRGNLANIIRSFPSQAVTFSLKDRYKNIFLQDSKKEKSAWRYLIGNMASGGAASATSLLLLYPLDFARTRLAADTAVTNSEREFSGMKECIVKTIKTDGVVGLYRGFSVSLPGVIIYRAISFGCFDTAKEMLPDSKKDSWTALLLIGLGATTLSAVASHPFDTVRRRMMMQSANKKGEILCKRAIKCWVNIYSMEGPGAFFRGVIPNVFRGIGAAIALVIYDEFKKNQSFA